MNENLFPIPADVMAELEAKAEASDEDFFIALNRLTQEWLEQNPAN